MNYLSTIEKYMKGPISELLTGISKEVKQFLENRLLEYQTESYRRCLLNKTLLNRIEPKPLLEFYFPLSLQRYEANISVESSLSFLKKQLPGDTFLRTEKVAASSNTSKSNPKGKFQVTSAQELFKNHNCILVVGDAGSGKSTLTKYLYIRAVEEKFKIPIRIPLRYLNNYKGSLTEYIFSEIFTFNRLAVSKDIIDRLLDSGKFLFFFDGYDEVFSGVKEKITRELNNFVKRYNKNYYLLTSRPYTDIDLLPLFYNYQVSDLAEGDIAGFINKQLPKEASILSEKIIATVEREDDEGYRSFLKNPMLLSMFILTFQSYPSIPQKRKEFYQQVFDTLYYTHNSLEKMAFESEKVSRLSKEQFESVLKVFSFLSLFKEKYSFSENYLNTTWNEIKTNRKNLDFDNEHLKQDLLVALAILREDGFEYTFSHKALQEYFSAAYIAGLSQSVKQTLYQRMAKRLIFSDAKELLKGEVKSENFISLLLELDRLDVVKYLLIPCLRRIMEELSTFPKDQILSSSKKILAILFSSYFFLQKFKLIEEEEQLQLSFQSLIDELVSSEIFMYGLRSTEEAESADVLPVARSVELFETFRSFLLSKLNEKIEMLETEVMQHEEEEDNIINWI